MNETEKELVDIKVFLVEPSHTQQMIIKQFMLDLGITNIICIESAEETLTQIRKNNPDLVISSMYLPDMTGADLVRKIREDSESYNMAFLLISSETKIDYLEPIRQAGTIAILPKPFTAQELDIALSAALDFLNPCQIELNYLDIEDISVLIVDDSAMSRKYITKILTDIGITQITSADDGKQALDLINQQYFDLIVTDLNMPEMNGLQLTTSIREDSNQRSIPILMVTSEQNKSRLAAVKQAGVSAVLDKPFEPSSIRHYIMQLLN